MKKFLSLLLLFSLSIPLLLSCGAENTKKPADTTTKEPADTTVPNTPPDTPKEPLDKNKEYSILFIGNSYTYYHSIPETIFYQIAKSAGYNVKVESITKGGHNLYSHANPNDEMGAKVEAALTSGKHYDYVILQDQSVLPASTPEMFYDAVRNLAKRIRDIGAEPVLYSTWGRKTGHSTLTEYGWTNESMTWQLAASYTAIGRELDIPVAYVGLAFYDVYTNNPDIDLYDPDKTHQSPVGAYLSALTLFKKIFGADLSEVTYRKVTEEVANTLKNAATKAVDDPPAIPKEYEKASEGVVYDGNNADIDTTKTNNLTTLPQSKLISVLSGGTYPNGKNFSGILGTKGQTASKEYSTTGLNDAQKADIADISYGVSVIGIEKMDASAKGYNTAIENLVNGHWGTSFMGTYIFDDAMYDINGNASSDGKYRSLITLNFGKVCEFDAFGFASGSLQGFPGAAEVYVSSDGVNWTKVPTACWDAVNGTTLVSCSKSIADPWNGNKPGVTCLFDMGDIKGQYIRIGIIIGRYDQPAKYNTINTREILVYGKDDIS